MVKEEDILATMALMRRCMTDVRSWPNDVDPAMESESALSCLLFHGPKGEGKLLYHALKD